MKTSNKKMNASQWVENEVSLLDSKYRKAKFRYKVLAIVLGLINLAAIVVASVAIDLIVTWEAPKSTIGVTKPTEGGNVGLILAILAAVVVIVIFVLNFVISLLRSLIRTKFYKQAKEEIYLEVMKFESGIDEYSKKSTKEEVLKDKVNKIRTKTLKQRRQNGKILKPVLRAFTGGFDE